MYSILIADDEELTRDGLTKYVDWDQLEIDRVYTACNGVQAVSIAEKYRPDILMTDIRMPHMDGIELTREFRNRFPDSRVILFSGHADKEYLKSAIKLRVDAYIDKPIDMDDVSTTVSDLVKQLKNVKKEREHVQLMDQAANSTIHLIKARIAQRFVSSKHDWDEFNRRFVPVYYKPDPNDTFIIADILADNYSDTENVPFNVLIHQYIQHNTLLHNDQYYVGLQEDRLAFVIFRNVNDRTVEEVVNGLEEFLKNEINIQMIAVIGEKMIGMDSIASEYKSVKNKMRFYNFYFSDKGICENIRFEERNAPEELFIRKEQVKSYVDDLLRVLAEERYSNVNEIRQRLYEIYVTISLEEQREHVGWESFRYYSLKDISNAIREELSASIRLDGFEKFDTKVKSGIAFIDRNYQDSALSVGLVAEHIGLSQNYFATLFKQNTGITVGDYVLTVRLSKAQYLLRNTDQKLYEIGQKIGIPDANYLNLLFKKKYGITPTQYRRSGV